MEFMYITNNPDIAKILDDNSVITWIDLETLGKDERQKGMNTVKSKHSINDIAPVKHVLQNTPLLVRINPINRNTKEEIDDVIEAGADIIMLPMFKNKSEVELFINLVNGRCKTMLLFETKASVENIDDILSLPGIDKVHIGLNDLHLSYSLKFMFELVTNGTVEYMCVKFKEHNKEYGFGGVAKLGYGDIPVEFVLLEHKRLGSSRAILSRSFCNVNDYSDINLFRYNFEKELKKIIDFEKGIAGCGDIFTMNIHDATKKLIENRR